MFRAQTASVANRARRARPCLLVVTGLLAASCHDVVTPSGPGERPAFGPTSGQGAGLAAYTPGQAVVFDGSTDPGSTYAVAFEEQVGYLLDLGDHTFSCPDATHRSRGGLFQVLAGRAVLPATILGTDPLPAVPADPAVLAAELDALTTDCQLLDHLATLESYLSAVAAEANQLVAQTQACLAVARDLYCRAVEVIEQAPTVDGLGGKLILGPGSAGHHDLFLGEAADCNAVLTLLHQIPGLLDHLESQLLRCLETHQSLTAIRQRAEESIAAVGGIPLEEKTELFALADAQLARAEARGAAATTIAGDLGALLAGITPESIEQSCADCSPDPTGFTGLATSGAVLLRSGREPLGRYIGALRAAASQTDDPALAARLEHLARRLATVAGDRVLRVTYASSSAVGQEHVAIMPMGAPDDGVSPLVVVLTALSADAPLPRPNTADLALQFEVFRLFRATVGPVRGAERR